MKIKIDKMLLIKVLIILLIINYMFVTIILNDNVIMKYMRDIILLCLLFVGVDNIKFNRVEMIFSFFLLLLIISLFKTDHIFLGVVSIRKYVFPILAMFAIRHLKVDNFVCEIFLNFILKFFAIIGLWGMFQAFVLKDDFLISMGYPTSYSWGYNKDILGDSFYFGGIGIQRVASTLSSSNICGLVLGVTLIFLAIMYPYITVRYKNIYLLIILFSFFTTFSRSNILGFLIVALFIAYPYIPKKRFLLFLGIVCVAVLLIISVYQGENSLIYRFYDWIKLSLTFQDSSSAGRFTIWDEALRKLINSPLGIGFGHVGITAIEAGVQDVVVCENSYFAIALDTGWLGLLVYILAIIQIITGFARCKRLLNKEQKFEKRLCLSGISIMIYLMVVMCFSNHIYDMEAITLVYIYIGIILNLLKESRISEVTKIEKNSILSSAISYDSGE